MPEQFETTVKGFKEAGIAETIKDTEAIYERCRKTFFRRFYKYYCMFEAKKNVLVRLISCRNLFYNLPFTSFLFFSLIREAELFLSKKNPKELITTSLG